MKLNVFISGKTFQVTFRSAKDAIKTYKVQAGKSSHAINILTESQKRAMEHEKSRKYHKNNRKPFTSSHTQTIGQQKDMVSGDRGSN